MLFETLYCSEACILVTEVVTIACIRVRGYYDRLFWSEACIRVREVLTNAGFGVKPVAVVE